MRKIKKKRRSFPTLLAEVAGQTVVQVLVELGAVSPLQPRAQTKVGQLHVALEANGSHTFKHRHQVCVGLASVAFSHTTLVRRRPQRRNCVLASQILLLLFREQHPGTFKGTNYKLNTE